MYALKNLPKPLLNYFHKYHPADAPIKAVKGVFDFQRHPVTQKLQDPVYSPRRKKQLYQWAKACNVIQFMPPLPPVEEKKVMRGTIKWKGTKQERKRPGRKVEIQQALSGMDEQISKWRRLNKESKSALTTGKPLPTTDKSKKKKKKR
jgi:hypothetical protein